VSGRALQVAVISKGEDPGLGMELLGLLQGVLKGEAKHQHATRVALAYPALREEGLGALGSTTHKELRVLAVGSLDEGEEVKGTLEHCGERSVALEGVEGVAEVHLASDALRIGEHACMEGVANAATASWDAHGHLEGVQLYPGSTSFHGTQAG
jgi:hypothetical protein